MIMVKQLNNVLVYLIIIIIIKFFKVPTLRLKALNKENVIPQNIIYILTSVQSIIMQKMHTHTCTHACAHTDTHTHRHTLYRLIGVKDNVA